MYALQPIDETRWPAGMQLVHRQLEPPPAPLVSPNGYGYVHIAAELEHPRPLWPYSRSRRALRDRVVAATAALTTRDGVRRVDVFDAVALPPGTREGREVIRSRGYEVHPAAFDLVVLVECDSPAVAASLRTSTDLQPISALLAGARRLNWTVAANARRIAEVDKGRNGVFLFNYFWTTAEPGRATVLLAVWEYTAGWFTAKASLDNSTLLQPLDQADSEYAAINHCRWDGLLDIVPHLVLRPSLRRFVLGNFTANGIVAMPVLYRLAGSNGRPAPRSTAGRVLFGLGVLHTLATIPAVTASLPYVRDRGWIGGIATGLPPPPEAMPALAALFSMVVGVLLLVSGGLVARLEGAGSRLPAWLGPVLAVTGLTGGLLLPPTGFWLVLLAGLWMTLRRR